MKKIILALCCLLLVACAVTYTITFNPDVDRKPFDDSVNPNQKIYKLKPLSINIDKKLLDLKESYTPIAGYSDMVYNYHVGNLISRLFINDPSNKKSIILKNSELNIVMASSNSPCFLDVKYELIILLKDGDKHDYITIIGTDCSRLEADLAGKQAIEAAIVKLYKTIAQ